MNPDVLDVQPLADHILRLVFEGGAVRDFDVKPYLDFGIFAERHEIEPLEGLEEADSTATIGPLRPPCGGSTPWARRRSSSR